MTSRRKKSLCIKGLRIAARNSKSVRTSVIESNAMQWNAFILLGVCAAAVCGHRMIGNGLHSPYAALKRSESVSVDDVPYNAIGLKTIDGSIGLADDVDRYCGRRYFGAIEGKVLRELRTANRYDTFDTNLSKANERFRNHPTALAIIDNDNITSDSRKLPDMQAPVMDDGSDVPSDIFAVRLNHPVAHLEENGATDLQEPKLTLPVSYYNEFYEDLLLDANKVDVKRAGTTPVIGCDCKLKNDLLDLGQQHFPRYLLNAVCQTKRSPNEYPPKCWRGSYCKPLEYKVKVLTFRTLMDLGQKDATLAWLPDDLRQLWKFKAVTVAAGCFCAKNDSK